VVRISIVIPCRNAARWLEGTLSSVLEQDYGAVEVIVRDGGSTDGSLAILERYHDRIADCVSQWDGGQADAIRRGFASASGEIQGWLNADDVYLPGALSAVAHYFEANPKVGVVVGGCVLIDALGAVVRDAIGAPRFNLGANLSVNRLLAVGCKGFNQPATFWRRDVYEAVGGIDPALQFSMDYDFYLRAAHVARFGRLARCLAAFRQHPESKSARLTAVQEAEDLALRARHQGDRRGGLLPLLAKAGPLMQDKAWARARQMRHWLRGCAIPNEVRYLEDLAERYTRRST
jgi:glycosyltransferase involved in cell wall biosynthesis